MEGTRLTCRLTAHLTAPAAALIALLAGCSPFKSEVPIVTIDTRGRAILDDPKVAADMVIHHDAAESTQSLSSRIDFQSAVGIELIGHSSLRFRKKSYGLILRDDRGARKAAALLGLPADSNWVLHGPYSDKSLMRNYLAYSLAGRLHLQSPRTRFVELFLRQGGWGLTYQGVYLLVEASSRSPEALRIATLQPGDTTGSAISGGYVLEVDRVSRGSAFFTLPGDPMSTHRDTVIFIVPRQPQPAQKAWLANYFGAMEASLPPARPPRYAQYLDVDSFVDFVLLQEALKNVDAYRFSASMYKDRDGKLRMGPVWDFDLSSGNASYDDGCDTDGWMVQTLSSRRSSKVPPLWWRRLLQDPAFVARLETRWAELRRGPLATDSVLAVVDGAALTLRHAQKRNFARFPTLGQRIWPNCPIPGSDPRAYHDSWEGEVRSLRAWLESRLAWMDVNIATIGP